MPNQPQLDLLNITKACGHIAQYCALALGIKVRERDPVARRRKMIENITRSAQEAIRTFRFEVDIIGRDAERLKKPHLFISNHMSYLDIILLAYSEPCVFVTSVDMGQTPGLGHLAEFGGSLFIERRNRSRLEQDIQMIVDVLKSGFHVVVFPEGTSSDGKDVLPFKKSLFDTAIRAGVDIQPICLKYTKIGGAPFGPDNHHQVCWYGDMGFLGHFVDVCTTPDKAAEIHYLPPIQVDSDQDRRLLAETTHRIIREEYLRR